MDFSDLSDIYLGKTQRGIRIHFLVLLKNSHLEVLRDYTKYLGGLGNLHIIDRRNQKLSIPRPNPYKQCAESNRQLVLELRARRLSSKWEFEEFSS